MVSTSGSQLLPKDAVSILRDQILPLTTVLTPNIPEAMLLLQREKDQDLKTREEMIELTKDLHQLGPKYILLKGGHLAHDAKDDHAIFDVLYDGKEVLIIEKPFIDTSNTHGTGCSLACQSKLPCLLSAFADVGVAAIASNIALGQDIPKAVRNACDYVQAGIKMAINRGKGSGPINHFHSSYMLSFAP